MTKDKKTLPISDIEAQLKETILRKEPIASDPYPLVINESSYYRQTLRSKESDALTRITTPKIKKGITPYQGEDIADVEINNVNIRIERYDKKNTSLTSVLTKTIELILFEIARNKNVFLENIQKGQEVTLFLDIEDTARAFGEDISTRQKKYNFKKHLGRTLETLRSMRADIKKTSTGLLFGSQELAGQDKFEVILSRFFIMHLESIGKPGIFLEKSSLERLKIKDQGAFFFHTRLNNHANQTANWHEGKKNYKQARRLTLETAVNWTGTLATIDEINDSKDRHFDTRIFNRMEEILNDPNGIIEEWEWCDSNGDFIDITQHPKTYEFTKSIRIHIKKYKAEQEIIDFIEPKLGRLIEKDEKEKKERQQYRKKGKEHLNKK